MDVEAKGIFDEKEFIIRSRSPLVFKIYVDRLHGKVFTSMIELSIYAEANNIIELIADINYEILFLWVAIGIGDKKEFALFYFKHFDSIIFWFRIISDDKKDFTFSFQRRYPWNMKMNNVSYFHILLPLSQLPIR